MAKIESTGEASSKALQTYEGIKKNIHLLKAIFDYWVLLTEQSQVKSKQAKAYPTCKILNWKFKLNKTSKNKILTTLNINNWRNQMAEIVITKENFQKEVLESDKTVLLDFFADWCGPCQMLSPIINEIAQENPQIKVGKINVDEQQELAMQYNVMSIPFLAVFKNGKLDRSTVGYMPKDVILKML